MRTYPKIPPLAARHFGVRMMYAPPYRHVPHTPLRPLVVHSSLNYPGAMLYCADMLRNLRRRFIMDVAQLLSGLALILPFSFLAGKLIDDPRWCLISIIPQACIVVGLINSEFCRPLYVNFANWWMRRFPHA